MTARYNRIRTRPRWRGGLRSGKGASPAARARLDEKLRRMGLVPIFIEGMTGPIAYTFWYRLN